METTDIVVIGAGLSGISAAAMLGMKCRDKSYVVLEARDDVGGTWDLFRYPGIRSDSDMHTLGFSFHPWKDRDAIASADKIKRYIADTIDKFGVRNNLRLGHRMIAADWSSERARWRITAERKDGSRLHLESRFLFMGSGYYDYAGGYDPEIEGQADFAGRIVHPQDWPADLDYTGRKVVVIGSGATAVTLIPSMADRAGHVTMLQRSPTYIVARPAKDRIANHMKTWLPSRLAYLGARWKNVMLGRLMRRRYMKAPLAIKPMLVEAARKQLPEGYDISHFTPRHQPWEQRICLAPDGDFFQAIHRGKASVVTGAIARIVADGIILESGEKLEADIIVKATGLKLSRGGGAAISVDGAPLQFRDTVIYKGAMYSNVPNFSLVFGYTGASWTLKADLTARYLTRVLKVMDRKGADIAVPAADVDAIKKAPMHTFTSGYIRRAKGEMPRQGAEHPWKVHQDYLTDRKIMLREPIEDGVLVFAKAGENWRRESSPAAPGEVTPMAAE